MMDWKELCRILKPDKSDFETAESLYAEYSSGGYLRRTPSDLLKVSDAAIAVFYEKISHDPKQYPSQNKSDSAWMAQSDFCFMNIRACGTGSAYGNFISAAKILPGLRVDAIHLGPFTEYTFHIIYVPVSLKKISSLMTHTYLEQKGFSAEMQLRAFVSAAHLLGKSVGFDIEPHMAQFSITGLEQPELFRWIKLDEKRGLATGSMKEMLGASMQWAVSAEVKAIVKKSCAEESLSSLDHAENDSPELTERKMNCFFRTTKELIESGYWSIPSQVWNCEGVPDFAGYDFENGYAKFGYACRDGIDRSPWAHHVLAPFAFYHNMLPNKSPDGGGIVHNEKAVEFFSHIFDYWRDGFGFDFVRYDSADHIFDSTLMGSHNIPASDRATPEILQRAVSSAKSNNCVHVGSLAERMGTEIEEYAAIGFDLILGSDMLRRIDRPLIEDSFMMYDRLKRLNSGRTVPSSVCFAVDTHDTGDPNIWKRPLVEIMGYERMALRLFVSRFISAGTTRRPKYECMGIQDLSFGLYDSNVNDINLVWQSNAAFNNLYHMIEDIYDEYRDFLSRADIISYEVNNDHAWWIIRSGDELLIPVCSLEKGDNSESYNILINTGAGRFLAVEYNREGTTNSFVEDTGHIHIGVLPYLSFRLFHLTKS